MPPNPKDLKPPPPLTAEDEGCPNTPKTPVPAAELVGMVEGWPNMLPKDVEAGVEVGWPNGKELVEELAGWPKRVVLDDVDGGSPKGEAAELAADVEAGRQNIGATAVVVVVTDG